MTMSNSSVVQMQTWSAAWMNEKVLKAVRVHDVRYTSQWMPMCACGCVFVMRKLIP